MARSLSNGGDLLRSLLEEAAIEADDGLDEAGAKAQMAFSALRLAESKRKQYRSAQAAIVVSIMQEPEPLWLALITDQHPQGFGSLKEMLQAAGLGRSAVYDLDILGTKVVPYCKEHNIPIEPYVTEKKYPLLAEALPELKRVLAGDSDNTVQEILDDISLASRRDSIRAKYRKSRGEVVGKATVHYLDDDRAVAIVVIDRDEVGKVTARLSNVVGWDELVASVKCNKRSIEVVIDDPKV